MSKSSKLLLILLALSVIANVYFIVQKFKNSDVEKDFQVSAKTEKTRVFEYQGQQEPEIKIKNPVIEVRCLKVWQFAPGFTELTVRITNKSDKFISYWNINADIFDSKGEYLGHSFTNGENLRPGQSIIGGILFRNVRAFEVASWELYIERLRIDLGRGNTFDATRYFKLKEIK